MFPYFSYRTFVLVLSIGSTQNPPCRFPKDEKNKKEVVLFVKYRLFVSGNGLIERVEGGIC